MCFWCYFKQIPRIRCHEARHRSKSRTNKICTKSHLPDLQKRRTKIDREDRRIKPVHIKILRAMSKFFQHPEKNMNFVWTEECKKALQQLKSYLTSALLLSKPHDGEMLFLYLAVSEHSVSVVFVRKDDGQQSPIYYVSKSLLDAETRYSQFEKLALALIITARKLRPYFQSHPITVLTSFPLKNILHKP